MHAENSPLPEPASPTPETTMPHCLTCVCEHPRRMAASELTELLDGLENSSEELGSCECFANDCIHEAGQKTYRRAVESLVEARTRERDALQGELNAVDQCLSRRDALEGFPTRVTKILEAIRVAAESDRVRSSGLSPEEAAAILDQPVAFMGPKLPATLIEKLRRISSSKGQK